MIEIEGKDENGNWVLFSHYNSENFFLEVEELYLIDERKLKYAINIIKAYGLINNGIEQVGIYAWDYYDNKWVLKEEE